MLDLNAHNRCDRCNAQAYHVTYHATAESELMFCNHHLAKHEAALLDQGWVITSDAKLEELVPATAPTLGSK